MGGSPIGVNGVEFKCDRIHHEQIGNGGVVVIKIPWRRKRAEEKETVSVLTWDGPREHGVGHARGPMVL